MATLNNAPFMLRGTCIPTGSSPAIFLPTTLESYRHWDGIIHKKTGRFTTPDLTGHQWLTEVVGLNPSVTEIASNEHNALLRIKNYGPGIDLSLGQSLSTSAPWTYEQLIRPRIYEDYARLIAFVGSNWNIAFRIISGAVEIGGVQTAIGIYPSWQHIVVESRSDNNINAFINGELVASGNYLGNLRMINVIRRFVTDHDFSFARYAFGVADINILYEEAETLLKQFGETF